MVVPFLPLYLFDLGVSGKTVHLWSGLIFSISFLMSAIIMPYWGRLADRAGKRRMVIRAGLSLGTVYFLASLVRSPEELFVVRVLQGLAGGFVPASFAIVASSAPADKMGFSLGLMQTATLTGSILGPMLGGTLAHVFGIRASFVVAALVIFLAAAAVRLLVSEPAQAAQPQGGSVWDDLRTVRNNRVLLQMMGLFLVVQGAIMVPQPFITLFVAELQGDLAEAALTSGAVLSLAAVAGAIAAPLWGRLGQATGFFRVVVIALAGGGLLTASQSFVGHIWQFALLQFGGSLFIIGVYPAINTIVVKNTDDCFQGRAFGLTTSANQLGAMIGPLLGGLVSSWVGFRPMFFGTGVVLLAVGLLVLLRRGSAAWHCGQR
jgi:DHA1 family multidrug resistance protein-like MFS transporter